MTRHFILDLDRTLFHTDRFNRDLMRWLEREYHIDEGILLAEQINFYTYFEDLYAYDLFRHLSSHTIDENELSTKLLSSKFASDAYLFDDAKELMDECLAQGEVTILSFGYENYQRLKYQLCPSITSRAPLVTTLLAKHTMLDTIATGPITMIDDKPIGDQLPDNVIFIQAVPEVDTPAKQSWPVYKTLLEVKEYIHEHTN